MISDKSLKKVFNLVKFEISKKKKSHIDLEKKKNTSLKFLEEPVFI